MSLTPNGNYFQELGNSPTLQINTQGISGTRHFWVPQSTNLTDFLQEVIGVWVLVGQNNQNGQSGSCFFQPPMAFSGYPNLVPSDISVVPKMPDSPEGTFPVGIGLGDPMNDYKGGWHVTVKYETVYNVQPWSAFQPPVPNGTYLSYEAELGAEYMETPGRSWVWGNDAGQYATINGKPDIVQTDADTGILRPTGNYTLTWDRVLEPPWTAIRQARGKVNATTFMGAPPGVVLYLGAQVTRQYQFTADSGFWKVQHKFSEKSVTLNSGTEVSGWNYYFRSQPLGGENWTPIYTFIEGGGGGEPPYASTDFSGLFIFDNGITC